MLTLSLLSVTCCHAHIIVVIYLLSCSHYRFLLLVVMLTLSLSVTCCHAHIIIIICYLLSCSHYRCYLLLVMLTLSLLSVSCHAHIVVICYLLSCSHYLCYLLLVVMLTLEYNFRCSLTQSPVLFSFIFVITGAGSRVFGYTFAGSVG